MLDIASWPPKSILTYWGRVTHICVGNQIIIGSDNGLSPGRRQAIFWTNAGTLLIGPLGTNSSEILIDIDTFSLKKCIWKCRQENDGYLVSASMCQHKYRRHKDILTGRCMLLMFVCLFFRSVDKRVVQIKKYSGLKFVNMLGAGGGVTNAALQICGAFISISLD